MKNYTILYSLFICFLLLACEDVVDIPLNEFDPAIVVDAWIDDLDQPQVITLSQTANYFNSEETPRINDAQVSVVRGDGQVFPFEFTENGSYVYDPATTGILGVPGQTFELSININGDEFCAATTLFRVPVIDSIGVELREDDIFLSDGLYTQFYARDFDGKGDAYWIKTFKNGVFRDNPRELNIAFDAAFDAGSGIDGIVFIPPVRELINPVSEDFLPVPWLPDETVKVEIHSMSVDAFQFMEIARDQMINGDNSIFALPLANTRGNVSHCTSGEEVLGFFNVASVSEETRVIE